MEPEREGQLVDEFVEVARWLQNYTTLAFGTSNVRQVTSFFWGAAISYMNSEVEVVFCSTTHRRRLLRIDF